MRVDLGKVYDQTITIVNKIDAKDSASKLDAFEKHVLHGCMWSLKTVRTVAEDGTVRIGTSHTVQIPESISYLPYKEWVRLEDRDSRFTIRTDDYIALGEVWEIIDSATTLRKVMANYEPDAFQVRAFRDATKGEGFEHSTAGAMRFAEPYIIEG